MHCSNLTSCAEALRQAPVLQVSLHASAAKATQALPVAAARLARALATC